MSVRNFKAERSVLRFRWQSCHEMISPEIGHVVDQGGLRLVVGVHILIIFIFGLQEL